MLLDYSLKQRGIGRLTIKKRGVDVSPDELRKRLGDGKVYVPDRASVAAEHFFRVGNLTALREMALRLTAERVDHQLRDYMQLKRIAGPWKSSERLLVAISPSPLSERLVRWTRRTTSWPSATARLEHLCRRETVSCAVNISASAADFARIPIGALTMTSNADVTGLAPEKGNK